MSRPAPPRDPIETTLSLEERKALGAFFTPRPAAEALVGWAVDRKTRRILDPSFGDGRILVAATERLRRLGVSKPGERVFGAELSFSNGRRSGPLRQARVPARNLLHGDFFATDLASWGGNRFDAIVGNPPYVRHHLFGARSKRLAIDHARRVGIALNERADAWAYFCAALLDYLAPSGRLALLLPGAILHADYALPLLNALSVARGHVQLIRVHERLFEDAIERTVVLLVDGRTDEPGVDYREVQGITDLSSVLGEPVIKAPRERRNATVVLGAATTTPALRLRARLRWFVTPEVAEIWNRVSAMSEIVRLGDVAKLRIGVVTGANRFFVIPSSTAERYRGRGVRTVPIISRGGWLKPLGWRGSEAHQEQRELLLIEPGARPRKALAEAIDRAEDAGIHERSHCRKRSPWYSISDSEAPQVFLPYMGAEPPRLVVNLTKATCTNAIHRVDLTNGDAAASVAVASWTSLYRLTAELVGRSYGGGVLKLELGEAAELRLPLVPGGAEHGREIQRVRAELGEHAAQKRADELVLRDRLGLSVDEINLIRREALLLQERRTGPKP